jgi:hypothetical protein
MEKFRNFHKGKVAPTPWFYLTALLFVMFILIGFDGIFTQEIEIKSKHILIQGEEAVFIGYIFLLFGVFSLYHLLFKTKDLEQSIVDYHDLEEFEEKINNYHTKFEYIATATPSGNNSILIGYSYQLSLRFNKTIKLNLSVKMRDKFEYFLWKIGLTRKFDILTGLRYFDSKYRVKTTNPELFRRIFTKDTLELLEQFDKDYPPIRKKNGTLHITDSAIIYIEGPYNKEQRLFDPHRGVIEKLFYELEKIASSIESTITEELEWHDPNYKLSTIDKIELVSNRLKPTIKIFTNAYVMILYIILGSVLVIAVVKNILQ